MVEAMERGAVVVKLAFGQSFMQVIDGVGNLHKWRRKAAEPHSKSTSVCLQGLFMSNCLSVVVPNLPLYVL
jgi:hypothetical protein